MSETLFHCESSDGFRMKFCDLLKSIAEMTVEHYMAPGKTIFVNSGIMYPDEEPDRTTIFYNLEHKYPIDENGHLKYCKPNWTEYVNTRYAKMDEIWDFQIENYEYFKFHGLEISSDSSPCDIRPGLNASIPIKNPSLRSLWNAWWIRIPGKRC